MKLFKKVFAVTTVLTLAFAAVPASAATDVVDFEDGNMAGFSALLTDADADQCELSVVDFEGSKALFVDVKDSTKIPKIAFDAVALVGAKNLDKIRSLKFDLTIVNPDGEAAGWNGGGIGAKTGADGSVWYQSPNGWTLEEYEEAEIKMEFTESFVKGMGFTKDATASGYLFMRWAANANDMYIDNVRFLDADGKNLNLLTASAEAPAEEKEDASKDAEAADDAAATTTTDAPKTGSTSYAFYFLAGAAVMLTGAIVIKRRKSVEE